ncbi:MAG: lytic transglycosylase domain-containing protein [Bacteroidales bacterium]|nr:lytic transglycosylase domain-containing protein [Bacteroidales bacterium]
MKKIILILICAFAFTIVKAQEIPLHPKAPSVPDYVDFAGERITFDRDDLYERMDRELMAFTYMHTTSSLMLKRSLRYFSQIVPILMEKGIPEDLKYLMVIESNLDPKAVSVTGAAGLWQFTKATAKQYGLEVNDEVDERYNIEKETIAACKYLKEAYVRYGDWMTVAASYNAGQAGISKRLQDQKEKSAMNLYLPEETSRYMFRILTAKLFMEHPERFGYVIDPSEFYPYRRPAKTVTVTGPVPSLVDFAKKNGVSYAALKRANLWLRSDKLTNQSGKAYQIIIPETN